jgi:hypothetical protein
MKFANRRCRSGFGRPGRLEPGLRLALELRDSVAAVLRRAAGGPLARQRCPANPAEPGGVIDSLRHVTRYRSQLRGLILGGGTQSLTVAVPLAEHAPPGCAWPHLRAERTRSWTTPSLPIAAGDSTNG